MAAIRIGVRVGSIALPAGSAQLDVAELRARVERELDALLEREPLRRIPSDRIEARGGRVLAAGAPTCASVAHVVARRIHDELRTAGMRP